MVPFLSLPVFPVRRFQPCRATAIALLSLALVIASPITAPSARAEGQPSGAAFSATQGTITVIGQGKASVTPDIASVTLTVTREAETARAALDAANAAMTTVRTAMRGEGIAERDLQTAQFSIDQRLDYNNDAPPRLIGYVVRNGLTVRIRDLTRVGAILDQAVSLGVNEGGRIIFSREDTKPALSEARRKAVEDAQARANELAAAAGLTLGPLRSLREQAPSGRIPAPFSGASARLQAADAASAVPIEAGELDFEVFVEMVWSIETP